MTEVSANKKNQQICSLGSTKGRKLYNPESEFDHQQKSDLHSTASTSSITSGSFHSPSSSLADLVSRDNQDLVRPKPHILSVDTSEGSKCTSATGIHKVKVDTKVFTHNTSSPGSSRSSTIHTLRVEGTKAIAPVPIVVRPAPLKNSGSISIKKDLNTLQLQTKIPEVRSQQHDEEHRRKLLLRQQQQTQQREAVARRKEEQLIREKKQQDQCNFPNPPITDNVAFNNYYYRNPNNNTANNRPGYNTMGTNPVQHSSQVKVMTQPQQNYVLDKSHLVHSHTINHPNESLDSSNHPTPLFERLVTEEVQEIKTYIRMIESLNRRLSDMQSVQDDLETRLEKSTQDKLEMESQLEDLNSNWVNKCGDLEEERDAWAKRCGAERGRNERLSDLVNRKDKEIQRMIQRKYDSKNQGHGHGHSNHKNARTGSSQQGHSRTHTSTPAMMQGMSPHDLLVQRGTRDAIRNRNAFHSLSDFFGM